MARIVLAAAFVLATFGGAHAQSTEQRYQGTFFVVEATGCPGVDAATVGRDYVFVFRTQSNLQRISITGLPYSVSFEPKPDPSRFAASGSYAATRIGSGADASEFSGKYSGFSTTPTSFVDGTQSVLVAGTIKNFDGAVDCSVKFRAAGARRPDGF